MIATAWRHLQRRTLTHADLLDDFNVKRSALVVALLTQFTEVIARSTRPIVHEANQGHSVLRSTHPFGYEGDVEADGPVVTRPGRYSLRLAAKDSPRRGHDPCALSGPFDLASDLLQNLLIALEHSVNDFHSR